MILYNILRRIFYILSVFIIYIILLSSHNSLPHYAMEIPKKDSIRTGSGSFIFTGYKPLEDKPVTVYYFRPENLPEDAPIMILLHGNGRNAEGYRKAMMPFC